MVAASGIEAADQEIGGPRDQKAGVRGSTTATTDTISRSMVTLANSTCSIGGEASGLAMAAAAVQIGQR